MKYTSLIIDDEYAARLMVKDLAKAYPELLEITGEASHGHEAVRMIEDIRPQLLFLDIQMPDLNGFEVLKAISWQPYVIFTTAFEQYALDAFEANSVDYLVKPIEKDRFARSMEKLQRFGQNPRETDYSRLEKLFEYIKPRKVSTAIPIRQKDKIILVRFSEIVYCEAADGYVSLITDKGKEYICDLTLQQLEERLPDNFLRVQKSYIVNKDQISEIHKYFNNRLILVMMDQKQTRITTGTTYINIIRESLEL